MGVIRNRHARLVQQRARRFRREPSHTERHMWKILRDRRLEGWKWRRQVVIGPYVVDFLCVEAALVVELDGDQHAARRSYDARRDGYLRAKGLRVLRFWNDDFLENPSAVTDAILAACAPLQSGSEGKGQGEARLGWRRTTYRGPLVCHPARPSRTSRASP